MQSHIKRGMIMKKIYLGFFVIIFTLNITGCQNEKSPSYEIRKMEEIIDSVSEENINNLITKEYSNKELRKIDLLDLNLEELDSKYRIECLRKEDLDESSFPYSVIYKSKNQYLIIYFNENGEKKFSYISKMSKDKDKFDFVKIGETKFIEIYLADFGNGMYDKFDSSMNWSTSTSTHLTKDGYVIIYEYDESNIVQSITIEMI